MPRKRDYDEMAEDATESTSCIDNNHPKLLVQQWWPMLLPFKQTLIMIKTLQLPCVRVKISQTARIFCKMFSHYLGVCHQTDQDPTLKILHILFRRHQQSCIWTVRDDTSDSGQDRGISGWGKGFPSHENTLFFITTLFIPPVSLMHK